MTHQKEQQMNSERELFEEWYGKNNDFMINTQFLMEGERYLDRHVRMAWLAWQASTQRQGYKLVPVEPTGRMLKHGSCQKLVGGSVLDIYKAMIGAVSDD